MTTQAGFFVSLGGVLANNAADPVARQAAGLQMKNHLDAPVRLLAHIAANRVAQPACQLIFACAPPAESKRQDRAKATMADAGT